MRRWEQLFQVRKNVRIFSPAVVGSVCANIDCVLGKNMQNWVSIKWSFTVLEQPAQKLYLCQPKPKGRSILYECLQFLWMFLEDYFLK